MFLGFITFLFVEIGTDILSFFFGSDPVSKALYLCFDIKFLEEDYIFELRIVAVS